jgi:type II secretion system protein N
MKMKKLALAAILVTAALVWGLWLVAIPEGLVIDYIEKSAKTSDMNVSVEGFRKGLFYNFTARSVSLERSGETVLDVRDLSGRLDLAGLFALKAVVPFEGKVSKGTLTGTAKVGRNGYEIEAALKGAELGELPALALTKVQGTGVLSGDFRMKDGRGALKFTVQDGDFNAISYGSYLIPLNMFRTARGAVSINGHVIDVESVTLEGKGLYARAKGKVAGGLVDMKLELMPEESAVPDSMMMAIAGRYRVSPGYYVIPIRTTIKGL